MLKIGKVKFAFPKYQAVFPATEVGTVLFPIPTKLSAAAARIPINRIPRVLCLEVKWSGCECEHLSPSGT